MLKSFSVEGYRSFHNKVVLDLGSPHDYGWHNDPAANDAYITDGVVSNALVLGGNATGKTNLGRALMDVRNNFSRRGPWPMRDESDPSFINGDLDGDHASFEYEFIISGQDIAYRYEKDGLQRIAYERLRVGQSTIFEVDRTNDIHDFGGMGQIGATGLNWDFSDEELSVLGYLSNSLPRKQAPLVYELRRFIDGMDMIGVPSSVPRRISMRGPLRRIARSEQLVRELERFLRENGVHERLKVIEGPEGEPSLYFGHRRPIPFELACSSGTTTLLLLFSRFFMRPYREGPSLVYIDEFDAYLHFEVAERLVRSFGGVGSCQTVCSTHNTSLLRNTTMRPDCVFVIAREAQDGGGTCPRLRIRSLADSTEREIRRINNVEHLYRNGEFD